MGLARRAGKLIVGTEQICLAMPKGKVALVVVMDSASAATKKKLTTKCEFYSLKMITADIPMGEVGRLLGKTYSPAAVATTDENFAKELIRLAECQVIG